MITPEEGVAMVFDKALDGDEFGLGETMIRGEGDRLEPELGLEIVAGDVDVGRFRALAGVEVEAVRADTEDGGHGSWGKQVREKAEDAVAARGAYPPGIVGESSLSCASRNRRDGTKTVLGEKLFSLAK